MCEEWGRAYVVPVENGLLAVAWLKQDGKLVKVRRESRRFVDGKWDFSWPKELSENDRKTLRVAVWTLRYDFAAWRSNWRSAFELDVLSPIPAMLVKPYSFAGERYGDLQQAED